MLQQSKFEASPIAIRVAMSSKDDRLYFACKRGIDVCMAALLLALLSPLMVLIAIWIKLDSRGPALFIQERVGARRRTDNGQAIWEVVNFRCYKFRTMAKDADPSIHQAHVKAFAHSSVNAKNGASAPFKLANDTRITHIGGILRKTSLDELPQLVNILKGEMSLVGPRPVPPYEIAEYQAWHHARLAALPGLTGLWQVDGRSRVSFDDMIRMDIDYIRQQSLWTDIKILLLTIPAVLSRRGAH